MPAKFPVKAFPLDEQVSRAMLLLQLHGATKPELWYAIDEVVNAKNREIEYLKNGMQIALDRWSKRQ